MSAAGRLAVVVAVLLLGAGSFVLYRPGFAMYDSVGQFGQALAGEYSDWHPPVMAQLWALLHARFGGAGEPLLALQLSAYWLGFGLIADALAATGRGRSAVAVLVLAASPLLLGWQAALLKDAQMLGALLAAVGLVAAFRLRERKVPALLLLPVVILFAYAVLVRANALFAVVPLAVLLGDRPAGLIGKLLGMLVGALAIIAVTPAINHRLLGASPTGVEKTQPLYDLAGIAMRDPRGSLFRPTELATIRARHCVKPFFWDPLGEESACGTQVERLQDLPATTLLGGWARAIVAHPLAYARHRVAHWNSTERWQVPPGLIGADPPMNSEPNSIGLPSPTNPLALAWQRAGAVEAGTPLGWPILWTVLALCSVAVAWTRRNEPAGGLALALAGSAAALEASFFVVSIASDLRYHLWAMTASALALILLADRRPGPRAAIAVALLGGIVAVGLYARATLPQAPATYAAMVASRAG